MVSVVICSYNREKFLPEALESLTKQSAEKQDFEIVIVNNNSTDNTESISQNFIKHHPELNVVYTIETSQGLSYARNKGIATAKGEIIAFMDDDAIARNDYIDQLQKHFDNYPEYGAIGGKVIPIYGEGEPEPRWMSKYIQGVVSKVDYGSETKPFTKKYPAGCNMAFRKSIFEKYGTFNTDLVYRGDDKYIFNMLKSHGVRVLYAPEIFVNHHIDAYRIQPEFIDKISRSIGASERLRLSTEPKYKTVLKFTEYLYKFAGAIALYFMFLFKGQAPKGHYCVKVMKHTITGFFNAKEFAQL